MKGKATFTRSEADKILALIDLKLKADRSKQKGIRDKIRGIGFYWEDFYTVKRKGGYNQDDFLKVIKITD